MFKMTRGVKESMLVFLKLFKAKGLARCTGENVLVASAELLGICRRLSLACALAEEHVHGTLTRLGVCGNNRFREMFSLLAQATDLRSVSTVATNIFLMQLLFTKWKHYLRRQWICMRLW